MQEFQNLFNKDQVHSLESKRSNTSNISHVLPLWVTFKHRISKTFNNR